MAYLLSAGEFSVGIVVLQRSNRGSEANSERSILNGGWLNVCRDDVDGDFLIEKMQRGLQAYEFVQIMRAIIRES